MTIYHSFVPPDSITLEPPDLASWTEAKASVIQHTESLNKLHETSIRHQTRAVSLDAPWTYFSSWSQAAGRRRFEEGWCIFGFCVSGGVQNVGGGGV